MKRSIWLVLAVLVLMALSPTCAPTPGPAAPEGEEPVAEPVTEAVAPGEVVTKDVISFWTWASSPFERQAIEDMARQFSIDTGIEVELVFK